MLPRIIHPMLAVRGTPFDSEEYIFEVKWDGFRVLLFCEAGSYRLMSRNSINLNEDFLELSFLSSLPPGTVLDGELVSLVDGKPDFESLKSRRPDVKSFITYFAFDILYKDFEPQMSLPLVQRKIILEKLLTPYLQERLALNAFVDTNGTIFFKRVKELDLEGVMAKQKTSLYFPGRRERTWKKIKRSFEIMCVIIGFSPGEDRNSFRSLMLASAFEGQLKYVGKVGTGFSHSFKDELFKTMQRLVVNKPIIPCPEPGIWIKPEVFCKVEYAELTQAGLLRAPVFKSLAA